MDKNQHVEFREVGHASGRDADEEVYFLGFHVDTIRNTWTRPGGAVFYEKEACLKRAERAVRRQWDNADF